MGQPVFLRRLMYLTWMLAVRRPFSTNRSMAFELPMVIATAQPRLDNSAATKYSPARGDVFGSRRAGFFISCSGENGAFLNAWCPSLFFSFSREWQRNERSAWPALSCRMGNPTKLWVTYLSRVWVRRLPRLLSESVACAGART